MNLPKIKVLVVEDSFVARKLLMGLINSDDRFELIGVAENGKEAIDFVKKNKPDVISMDIFMPLVDGLEATKKIMQDNPVPIVIVSGLYEQTEIEMAMCFLDAGAVMIIPRPAGPGNPKYEQSGKNYLNSLKSMSEIRVVSRKKTQLSLETERSTPRKREIIVESRPTTRSNFQALAIGASAGGPEGVRTILSNLPSDFPLPVFLVQHIDSNFVDGFAAWLNATSKLPVKIAGNNEKIVAGQVYLPPANCHLVVNDIEEVGLSKELPINGLRPSVDVLFRSIARVYGNKSLVVLLSGMGKDGAAEMKKLYDMGAYTIAQDEASCLVFGMPGEAVKLGGVSKLLSPEMIVEEIKRLIK